jgi:S1-C subfamily serine protease
MPRTEWDIPTELQPDPADFGFDLDRALSSVVGLKTNVPAHAFTASILGTERLGNGVVIRPDGLVLTIGYLITEAESIWLIASDGRAVPGDTVAYDHGTGFGLVQPLGRLGLPHLEPAKESRIRAGDRLVVAAGGGRHHAVHANVVGREPFAGYWEYLLDDALFTAPAHPFWSGAAAISESGQLLGVGSLILQRDEGQKRRTDMNMIVPSWLLEPILTDLLTYGRVNRPPRPWIGINAVESGDAIFIGGVTEGGPADSAGVQPGDRIVAVDEQEVADLTELWRAVWACGDAGARVRLTLARKARSFEVDIDSVDRMSRFTTPKLH